MTMAVKQLLFAHSDGRMLRIDPDHRSVRNAGTLFHVPRRVPCQITLSQILLGQVRPDYLLGQSVLLAAFGTAHTAFRLTRLTSSPVSCSD